MLYDCTEHMKLRYRQHESIIIGDGLVWLILGREMDFRSGMRKLSRVK